MKEILRVLVGSRAHNLATPESDYDYRSVFIVPTSEFLKVGVSPKTTGWIEGDTDQTSWEIGHFLHLATKSNPSILEVFKGPVVVSTPVGNALRELFQYVWSSKLVYDAFVGYSRNQQTKLFSDKEEHSKRKAKYAVAYIRTLLQGTELLSSGDFSSAIRDKYTDYGIVLQTYSFEDSWREVLLDIKTTFGREDSFYSLGEIVDICDYLRECIASAYKKNPFKEVDMNAVNEFLLKVRKDNW